VREKGLHTCASRKVHGSGGRKGRCRGVDLFKAGLGRSIIGVGRVVTSIDAGIVVVGLDHRAKDPPMGQYKASFEREYTDEEGQDCGVELVLIVHSPRESV